jgi:predicted DNA-binding protein
MKKESTLKAFIQEIIEMQINDVEAAKIAKEKNSQFADSEGILFDKLEN